MTNSISDLKVWTARPEPTNKPMAGRTVSIVPFDAAKHGDELWEAFGGDTKADQHLTYYGWPHLGSAAAFVDQLEAVIAAGNWACCVFCLPGNDRAVGMASYMRTDAANGVTEVGCVGHGSQMAGTAAATEAHYLMARRVFDEVGYRRYEWKLNNLNEPSHRAAKRFGFTFEGIFRQHQVTPRGNRDTAWYAMLHHEWPLIRTAFENWLNPGNFDANGRQLRRLEDVRKELSNG